MDALNQGQEFTIEDMPEGRTLVVTGRWSAAAERLVAAGEVDGVWLNYARGFSEPDLEFLDAWPIRRLKVLDRKLTDLTPLERLGSAIRVLSVQAGSGAVIDLAKFPRLSKMGVSWHLIRETIGRAPGLQIVTALDYDESDLWPFARNEALRFLALKNAPRLESLAGVQELSQLTTLHVRLARRLQDISDVSYVSATLRDFSLESCNHLGSLEGIQDLPGLQVLEFGDCGRIRSLAPVALLLNLEVIRAFGSTWVEDEDLTPLTHLPLLRELRMKDRQPYVPRVGAIQRNIGMLARKG
jgi:hypothetical protein